MDNSDSNSPGHAGESAAAVVVEDAKPQGVIIKTRELGARDDNRQQDDDSLLLPPGWSEKLLAPVTSSDVEHQQQQQEKVEEDMMVSTQGESDETADDKPWAQERDEDEMEKRSVNSDILRQLGHCNEYKFVRARFAGVLEELQDDVATLATLVEIRMDPLGPPLSPGIPRQPQEEILSEVAYLSVLEIEEDILQCIDDQIEHIDDDGYGAEEEDVLFQRLDALYPHLQAVFLMECEEMGRNPATTIDDAVLMGMAMQTQTRTELVRNIEKVLTEKRRIRQELSRP